jgi:hypothetical protein
MNVEAYELKSATSNWSFGRVYLTPRKTGMDRRWRCFNCIEEGVHWSETLADAQQWLLDSVIEAFAKLDEYVPDDSVKEDKKKGQGKSQGQGARKAACK